MQKFVEDFRIIENTRILDVGGTPFNWRLIDSKSQITFINLASPKGEKNNWVIADGCDLPFKNQSFDIVYSNSVIEHLSKFEKQQKFAQECTRVGKRYYVQTPNKWFFVEPHLLTPFIHWLSRRLQSRLLRNFTVWGLITRPTQRACDSLLDELRLLDENEVKSFFPKAEIWQEKFLGMTKSFIATGTSQIPTTSK